MYVRILCVLPLDVLLTFSLTIAKEPSNLAFSFLVKFISVKATVQNYKEMQNPCFSHILFKSKSFPFQENPTNTKPKRKRE